MLENADSVGVDELVPMDALELAKSLFPVGMFGKTCVCPKTSRGLYAARDEVLFVSE